MTGKEFQVETGLIIKECISCGMTFAVSTEFIERRRESHEYFYCPNGHAAYFPHETEEEKLKRQLEHCSVRRVELEQLAREKDYSARYWKGRARKALPINHGRDQAVL